MFSSSSLSDSDSSEGQERKRQVQEAVSGVNVSSINSVPSAKKQKLSKRVEEQDTSGSLVSSENRKFIAKKLSHFLDKQYEVETSVDDTHTPSISSQVSCIKLLRDSTRHICLSAPSSSQISQNDPKTRSTFTDVTSSESETETLRLKEAAVTFSKKKI